MPLVPLGSDEGHVMLREADVRDDALIRYWSPQVGSTACGVRSLAMCLAAAGHCLSSNNDGGDGNNDDNQRFGEAKYGGVDVQAKKARVISSKKVNATGQGGCSSDGSGDEGSNPEGYLMGPYRRGTGGPSAAKVRSSGMTLDELVELALDLPGVANAQAHRPSCGTAECRHGVVDRVASSAVASPLDSVSGLRERLLGTLHDNKAAAASVAAHDPTAHGLTAGAAAASHHRRHRRRARASFAVVNYHMAVLGQGRDWGGHFAPVGAYHRATDAFLILDTWPDTEPVWAPTAELFAAVATDDAESCLPRGVALLELHLAGAVANMAGAGAKVTGAGAETAASAAAPNGTIARGATAVDTPVALGLATASSMTAPGSGWAGRHRRVHAGGEHCDCFIPAALAGNATGEAPAGGGEGGEGPAAALASGAAAAVRAGGAAAAVGAPGLAAPGLAAPGPVTPDLVAELDAEFAASGIVEVDEYALLHPDAMPGASFFTFEPGKLAISTAAAKPLFRQAAELLKASDAAAAAAAAAATGSRATAACTTTSAAATSTDVRSPPLPPPPTTQAALRTLSASRALLLVSGDCYSAWNARKRAVEAILAEVAADEEATEDAGMCQVDDDIGGGGGGGGGGRNDAVAGMELRHRDQRQTHRERLRALVEAEVSLTTLVFSARPKATTAWAHRRWTCRVAAAQLFVQFSSRGVGVEGGGPDGSNGGGGGGGGGCADQLHRYVDEAAFWARELAVCGDVAAKHPKNYFAWTHRLWAVHKWADAAAVAAASAAPAASSFPASTSASSVTAATAAATAARRAVLFRELVWARRFCGSAVSDRSAAHHHERVLAALALPNGGGGGGGGGGSCGGGGGGGARALAYRELRVACGAAVRLPGHEALWAHATALARIFLAAHAQAQSHATVDDITAASGVVDSRQAGPARLLPAGGSREGRRLLHAACAALSGRRPSGLADEHGADGESGGGGTVGESGAVALVAAVVESFLERDDALAAADAAVESGSEGNGSDNVASGGDGDDWSVVAGQCLLLSAVVCAQDAGASTENAAAAAGGGGGGGGGGGSGSGSGCLGGLPSSGLWQALGSGVDAAQRRCAAAFGAALCLDLARALTASSAPDAATSSATFAPEAGEGASVAGGLAACLARAGGELCDRMRRRAAADAAAGARGAGAGGPGAVVGSDNGRAGSGSGSDSRCSSSHFAALGHERMWVALGRELGSAAAGAALR